MPSRSELLGEIKRKKFTRALQRLGFVINEKDGDGSHVKALWPTNQKSITIPKRLEKDVLYYILKEIETYTDVSWEDIKTRL